MDDVKAFKVDCVSHPCTWTMEFFLIESCELLIAWTNFSANSSKSACKESSTSTSTGGTIVLTLLLSVTQCGPWFGLHHFSKSMKNSVMTNDTAAPKQWNVFSSNVFVTSNTLVSFFLITIANRVKWFLHSKNAYLLAKFWKAVWRRPLLPPEMFFLIFK